MADAHRSESQAAELARLVVQSMLEYSGRGPTQASTVIGKNSIHVVLGDTLTKSERTLAEAGYESEVLASRKRLQDVLRPHLVVEVERIVGRRVIAFLSDNHIAPDMAVESFVLEPVAEAE